VAAPYEQLGRDVGVTRYVGTPAGIALDEADSWRGVDLALVAAADAPRGAPTPEGLEIVSGRANLGQRLIMRLLTPRGGLAALGHADYGSRLGELIGRLNDAATRNVARLYTLEALAQEPRVREVLALEVTTLPASPDAIRISFSVLPLHDDEPLSLGLEVTL
jgi:phage baseplate assembly protein W